MYRALQTATAGEGNDMIDFSENVCDSNLIATFTILFKSNETPSSTFSVVLLMIATTDGNTGDHKLLKKAVTSTRTAYSFKIVVKMFRFERLGLLVEDAPMDSRS